MKKSCIWVGSYTGGVPGKGVYTLEFDGQSLRIDQTWEGLADPSYLQPVGDRVFAVEETAGSSVAVELLPGGLRRFPVSGGGLCHIAACGGFLYVSDYQDGRLAGLDPRTGLICAEVRHQGKGANPLRQDRPHVHSTGPAPDGKTLLAADLGLDRLYRYSVGPKGELSPFEPQPWVQTAPGRGPRHFAFYPGRNWLYLVAELTCQLIVYRWDPETALLTEQEELFLCGPEYREDFLAADLHFSPDGRFLYVSVRGADSLYCFRIDGRTGSPEPAGRFSSCGRSPRSFHLSPDGAYAAVANQLSDSVVILPRSADSGALGPAVQSVSIPGASCVKWTG